MRFYYSKRELLYFIDIFLKTIIICLILIFLSNYYRGFDVGYFFVLWKENFKPVQVITFSLVVGLISVYKSKKILFIDYFTNSWMIMIMVFLFYSYISMLNYCLFDFNMAYVMTPILDWKFFSFSLNFYILFCLFVVILNLVLFFFLIFIFEMLFRWDQFYPELKIDRPRHVDIVFNFTGINFVAIQMGILFMLNEKLYISFQSVTVILFWEIIFFFFLYLGFFFLKKKIESN